MDAAACHANATACERSFWVPRVALFLACLLGALPIFGQPKPNIIIFLTDDLGNSSIQTYGGAIQTPVLDALASEGAAFSNYYVQPRCSPTRAALMTGHQNHLVGFPVLSGSNTRLTRNHVFLPELLRDAGYHTYLSGKWHLGATDNFGGLGTIPGSNNVDPRVRGFDHAFTFINSSHSERNWVISDYRMISNDPSFPAPAARYATDTDGDYNRYDETGTFTDSGPATPEFYQTDAIGDYALDFLQHHRARNTSDQTDDPFFFYVAFGAPHFPVEAPREVNNKYSTVDAVTGEVTGVFADGWDDLRADRVQAMIGAGVIPSDLIVAPRGDAYLDPNNDGGKTQIIPWAQVPEDRKPELIRNMAVYAAMVDMVDQNIGRIVDDLKANGEFDNTLILFMSDNGMNAEGETYGGSDNPQQNDPNPNPLSVADLQNLGNPLGPYTGTNHTVGTAWATLGATPFRNYKHFTHEGGIKSVLIVSWPGGLHPSLTANVDDSEAGMLFHDQVMHVNDVMPTLLDLAGTALPGNYTALDGGNYNVVGFDPFSESWATLLTTGVPIGDREFAIEHEGNRMYRDGDWKIVSSNFVGNDGDASTADNTFAAGESPALIGANEWELYNLADDPAETDNLANEPAQASRLLTMIDTYNQWALRNNVIDTLPPDQVIPPAPLAPRANDLFLDSFSRNDSNNADASAGGMSGASVPPLGANATYFEGFEGSGTADSIAIDTTMLRMATGNGMSENGIDHNFTDQAITDAGGFTIGLEVLQIDSATSDTANRYVGFGVGMSQAEASVGADIGNATLSLRSVLADCFVELDLNGDVQVRSNGSLLATVPVGAVQGRLEATFYVNNFNAGQPVTLAVFFEGNQLDLAPGDPDTFTLAFNWDASNQNYIGLSARASNQTLMDNLRVATLLKGDTDGDGDVDDTDLGVAISNFTGPGGGGKTAAQGDTDGDGDVDDSDLGQAISNFTGPNP